MVERASGHFGSEFRGVFTLLTLFMVCADLTYEVCRVAFSEQDSQEISFVDGDTQPRPNASPSTQPWDNSIATTGSSEDSKFPVVRLTNLLQRFHAVYADTGLIQTSINSDSQRYIQTDREALLILLAADLGLGPLARRLVGFYAEKSQNGFNLLFDFYDAKTGAAQIRDIRFTRLRHSKPTASANLLMAEAALFTGLKFGDPDSYQFGMNLLEGLLEGFRLSSLSGEKSRGIVEYLPERVPFFGEYHFDYGQPQYKLGSNSRCLLLLDRLLKLSGSQEIATSIGVVAWRGKIKKAHQELSEWFRIRIMEPVENNGIVPREMNQTRVISGKASGLGVDIATDSEGWIQFLRTAWFLDLASRQHLLTWFGNIAQQYGVEFDEIWGLDWTFPVLRRKVISSEMTGEFLRLARLFGHEPAARLAQRSLQLMGASTVLPVLPEIWASDEKVHPFQTGMGTTVVPDSVRGRWPVSMVPYARMREPDWGPAKSMLFERPPESESVNSVTWDQGFFVLICFCFYGGILTVSLSSRRKHKKHSSVGSTENLSCSTGSLVPSEVIQKAEQRWAKTVVVAHMDTTADTSGDSNFSFEQDFVIPLRSIYQMVLEWRRMENGWQTSDSLLVEESGDPWINGMDEFAVLVEIYSCWVVKQGRKDGFYRKEFLNENEDCTLIGQRLKMYFTNYQKEILNYLTLYKSAFHHGLLADQKKAGFEIGEWLSEMGLRTRNDAFDTGELLNLPGNSKAMDHLMIQVPHSDINDLLQFMTEKLGIPSSHSVEFIRKYKEFKGRKNVCKIHPMILEAARVMPHFILIALFGLIGYGAEFGYLTVWRLLKDVAVEILFGPSALLWEVPVCLGIYFGWKARRIRLRRYISGLRVKVKEGLKWNPLVFDYAAWAFRILGFLLLAFHLLRLPAGGFVSFMLSRTLILILVLFEVGATLLPVIATVLSKYFEDRVSLRPNSGCLTRFINNLNIRASQPSSLVCQSFRHHFQSPLPIGTSPGILRELFLKCATGFLFLAVGGCLYREILGVWFYNPFLHGWDYWLFLGCFLFWNTLYLLWKSFLLQKSPK